MTNSILKMLDTKIYLILNNFFLEIVHIYNKLKIKENIYLKKKS
jgi:hypothetical protein